MTTTSPADRLLVGRITRPHGIRGDVKVQPETDDPARLTGVETLHVGATPEATRPMRVEAVRTMTTKQGLTALVRFVGVSTPEAADALRGLSLYADASELPPLDADEYFLHDLVGLAVEDTDGLPLGRAVEVAEMPGHPVLTVETASGERVMVPAVPAFLTEIDVAGGRIVIATIDGLFRGAADVVTGGN